MRLSAKTAKPLAITVMRLLLVGPKMLHMKKLLILGVALAATTALSTRADDGKAIYEKDCAKCHGADGKGQTKMGQKLGVKDYTDAKVQAEIKDEEAIKAIKEGVKDKEGKQVMKPLEGVSDADAKALVAYIRTFKK
jgi:mono/diheme cytochrome c family protein